jgi:hypothetical protein
VVLLQTVLTLRIFCISRAGNLERIALHGLLLLAWLALAASPGLAQTMPSEVTGNWAGLQENDYWFRAQLLDGDGGPRLLVWNGDLLVEPRTPSLDVTGIVGLVGTQMEDDQGLDVNVMDDATDLLIVTKSADGRHLFKETVHIRYFDAQFTVVGYSWSSTDIKTGDAVFDCSVDLVSDVSLVNGEARDISIRDFAAKNAAFWTATSAVDLGYCPARD